MTSKLAQMQARFQQKQMQEREEKLLKLYESQQQRVFDRVGRGSAGSNTSVGSTGGGKVRQMFDERRQKAGIDKSYPLEPLKSKTNSRGNSVDRKTTAVVKSTIQNSVSSVRNGKPVITKREVIRKVYNNNNGDESYEEHRYEDDGKDLFNSKSHREMIEMMNNHNLEDSLDNTEIPAVGFYEVDHSNHKSNSTNQLPSETVPKKTEPIKRNGIHLDNKKETNTTLKKVSKTSPPPKTVAGPLRTVVSPPALKSKENTPPASSTMSKVPKTSPSRTPNTNRPSAKQAIRSGVVRDDLAECNFCGRRFATDRIQKHQDVCSKTGKKKRKVYDSTKHRVNGTELESYVIKPGAKKAAASSKAVRPAQKKDWRRTHEEFIAAIRAAKEAQAHVAKGGKLSDLPPPPPASNPDYVQCPHCGRKFNQAAAERHIPKCANYQFNKTKSTTSAIKAKTVVRK